MMFLLAVPVFVALILWDFTGRTQYKLKQLTSRKNPLFMDMWLKSHHPATRIVYYSLFLLGLILIIISQTTDWKIMDIASDIKGSISQ